MINKIDIGILVFIIILTLVIFVYCFSVSLYKICMRICVPIYSLCYECYNRRGNNSYNQV